MLLSNAIRNVTDSTAVPVIAVRARQGTIHEYFDGLGAVTPIYTVTIKSRVDGQLINILYKRVTTLNKGIF